MARGRGNRISRAFANFGLPSVREAEPPVISRNLAINLNDADGVVCQVQDHAQGVDETIEVTVIPKRRHRRIIVRVEDDESADSSEPEVVVTTSKSGPDHLGRCHRQQRNSGRNDENVPPVGNSDGRDDMPVPRPTGRGHSSIAESFSASAPPPAATSDLFHRIRQMNIFKSSRATKDQRVDNGKSKDTRRPRHHNRRSEMYRHGDDGYNDDNDSGRTRSSRGRSSGSSTPASYLDDYEHCCHSCQQVRNSNVQKEHPVREGERARPNLCTNCRDKLADGHSRVLGPRGEDLSKSYWCKSCGFKRSTQYRIRHGPPGAAEHKSGNICTLCVGKSHRLEEDGRRKAALRESKLPSTREGRDGAGTAGSSRAHRQDNPRRASWTTFSSVSTHLPDIRTNNENGERSVPSGFALPHAPAPTPAPTHRRRRIRSYRATAGLSQPREDYTSTNTNDESRGKAKAENTTRTAGGGSSRMANNANEAIKTEVDNGNDTRNAAAPTPTSAEESQAEEAPPEGFIHNSAEHWAALNIDDVLIRVMEMGPEEKARRKARLNGGQPSRPSSPDEYAARGASLAMELNGPRVFELTSDDEDE